MFLSSVSLIGFYSEAEPYFSPRSVRVYFHLTGLYSVFSVERVSATWGVKTVLKSLPFFYKTNFIWEDQAVSIRSFFLALFLCFFFIFFQI